MGPVAYIVIISSMVSTSIAIVMHSISMRLQRKQAIKVTDQANEWVKAQLEKQVRTELEAFMCWQYDQVAGKPSDEDIETDRLILDEYMEHRTKNTN